MRFPSLRIVLIYIRKYILLRGNLKIVPDSKLNAKLAFRQDSLKILHTGHK